MNNTKPHLLGLREIPLAQLGELLECLAERGYRCGVVQQATDDFDPDIPGKDSHSLRHAGVSELMLASEYKSALLREFAPQPPGLEDCLAQLVLEELDLVLFLDPPIDWLATAQQLHWQQTTTPAALAEHIQTTTPKLGDRAP